MSQFAFTANGFGEVSSSFAGRRDLPLFLQGVSYSENWLPYSVGGTMYRPGSRYVGNTKFWKTAVLKRFVYDEQLSYTLCFTDGYCRFFDNGSATLRGTIGITGITKAATGVVTTDGSHDFVNGDEVYLTGIKGMTALNDRFFTVKNKTATTFELYDITNTIPVDTRNYTAYSTGGDVSYVLDVPSPYGEEDLRFIKRAQKAKSVYFADGYHELQFFSFDDTTQEWIFQPYTRTNDPFARTITAVSNTSPRIFTIDKVQGYETDEVVFLRNLGGCTELNDRAYRVEYVTSKTFILRDIDTDAEINAGSAYTSGGFAAFANDQPNAVGFYGGRFWAGGTENEPNAFWGSRGPDNTGLPRFNDFTTGSNADDSIKYTIQSQNDTVEFIRFFAGTPKFLAIGALGGIYKATGTSGDGSAITNTSIYVAPADYIGSANIEPVFISSELYYVQRGKHTLNQFGFDFYRDAYVSKELSLYSDELYETDIVEIARQRWLSDLVWNVCANGEAVVMSSKANENQAFSRISTPNGKYLSMAAELSEEPVDLLYAVVEREINGQTVRYIETQAQDPQPIRRERFIKTTDKQADDYTFALATVHAQRQYIRMDSSIIYNGKQAVSLTIDENTLQAVAGSAIFAETDVDRLIAAISIDGVARGVAKIIDYVNTTTVEVEILEEFTDWTLAANTWELSTNIVTGFDHLEGQTVRLLTDGGLHDDRTVSAGSVILGDQYFFVSGGLGYKASMCTNAINHVIDSTNTQGIGYVSTIDTIALKYRNSLGIKFGLDPYALTESEEFDEQTYGDLPPLIQSAQGKEAALQGYNLENKLWLVKDDALPADILTVHCSGTVGRL